MLVFNQHAWTQRSDKRKTIEALSDRCRQTRCWPDFQTSRNGARQCKTVENWLLPTHARKAVLKCCTGQRCAHQTRYDAISARTHRGILVGVHQASLVGYPANTPATGGQRQGHRGVQNHEYGEGRRFGLEKGSRCSVIPSTQCWERKVFWSMWNAAVFHSRNLKQEQEGTSVRNGRAWRT